MRNIFIPKKHYKKKNLVVEKNMIQFVCFRRYRECSDGKCHVRKRMKLQVVLEQILE